MDSSFNTSSLRNYYMKNKNTSMFSFLMSGLVLICAVLLVIFVLIPQIQAWLALRDQEEAVRSRIAVLQSNLTTLQNMNLSQLNDDYELTTSVLPADKDFAGMLNALTLSALKANVALDDFTFNVGKLASGSASPSVDATPLIISVSVKGDMKSTNNFITEMEKRIPIASAVKVEASQQSSSTDLEFYTKSFPKSSDTTDRYVLPLRPLTDDEKTISALSQWQEEGSGLGNVFDLTNSSQSGTLTEPPF